MLLQSYIFEHTRNGYRTEQAFRRVKHEAQISDLIHRSEQGTVVTYHCFVHSRIQCCSL
jgi:hypothetical protein